MTADKDTSHSDNPTVSGERTRPRRRTKKEERAFQIKAALAVIVIVSIIIAIAVMFAERNSKVALVNPANLEITVQPDGAKTADALTVTPYQACALGEDCEEGTPTPIPLPADGSITVTVPPQVKQSDWRIIKIYEDEQFDTESTYEPGGADRAEIRGSFQGSRLKVAEVHAVMIGKDDAGDEQAYTVVWALQPQ